jgi:farnesyl diphosphate synthase
MKDLNYLLEETAKLVDKEIKALLPTGDDRLSCAMRYSALSMGKRLRPFILLSVADMFKVERKYSLKAAAAIEIIHSYSLIHDDLPAMDDDDFRRGMPSCHKQFDEATAILAGDALLTLAFEILSDPFTHPDASVRCSLIQILAKNIGVDGISGGQMLDLIYEREIQADYAALVNTHWMKTARLFMASCQMGAKLGFADELSMQHLMKYGEYFGLAFQFVDDLADLKQDKPLSNNNVVKLMGEGAIKLIVQELLEKAKQEVMFFTDRDEYLTQVVEQLLEEVS